MPIPDKPAYEHGSTGTQPSQPRDYNDGDPVDDAEFDHFIYVPFHKIRQIIDALADIKTGTIQVGDAAEADVAASANAVDGADVNGQVASAAVADQAKRFEVRNNDPQDPADGRVWIRSDL